MTTGSSEEIVEVPVERAETAKVVPLRAKRPPASDGAVERPSIFIATPAYGGSVTAQYVVGLLNLCDSLGRSGIRFELGMLCRESLITRARNKLVADFLASTCSHLLFIDADIGFHAKDVKPLVESGFDVVCGSYPMKGLGWKGIVEAAKEGKAEREVRLAGARYALNLTPAGQNGAEIEAVEKGGCRFVQVQDAATGFLLLSRKCLDAYIRHYGDEIRYVADYEPNNGQTHHMVFQAEKDPSVTKGRPARYLSEDYSFSRRWQMMGGEVWCCLDCELVHVGLYEYEGHVRSLFDES